MKEIIYFYKVNFRKNLACIMLLSTEHLLRTCLILGKRDTKKKIIAWLSGTSSSRWVRFQSVAQSLSHQSHQPLNFPTPRSQDLQNQNLWGCPNNLLLNGFLGIVRHTENHCWRARWRKVSVVIELWPRHWRSTRKSSWSGLLLRRSRESSGRKRRLSRGW